MNEIMQDKSHRYALAALAIAIFFVFIIAQSIEDGTTPFFDDYDYDDYETEDAEADGYSEDAQGDYAASSNEYPYVSYDDEEYGPDDFSYDYESAY